MSKETHNRRKTPIQKAFGLKVRMRRFEIGITQDVSLVSRFANNLASIMDSNCIAISSSYLQKEGDVAGVLTNLNYADILCFDDLSNINRLCYQYFERAIESFSLNLMVDTGSDSRTIQVKLNEFTLVAATPKINSLNRKFLASFFCIMKEVDMREFSNFYVVDILNEFDVVFDEGIMEYFVLQASRNGVDIESFVKNVVKFLQLSHCKNNTVLDRFIIDSYLEFSGIQDLNKESVYSRSITSNVKREVWRRDEGMCVLCRSQERLEFDHIIPFSKGGSNTVRNIQLLCEDCNRAKGSKI